MPAPLCIALLTDRPGWHSRQLVQAFERLNIQTRLVDPRQCAIDLSVPSGLVLPGFEPGLPAGVLVRGIGAGSFEQVTLRLGMLHVLAGMGVPVSNSAAAIERTVDKSATSLLMHRQGLATPPSLATDQRALAEQWLANESAQGYFTVLKPLFGAEGLGLQRLAPGDRLPDVGNSGQVFYLQRFVASCREGGARDIRLFVVGEQVRYAMQRSQADKWITNVARGGQCTAFEPSQEQQELALRATRAVGADYAGVDMVIDVHGKPWLLEVNSVPAWSGLQSVCKECVADSLAQAFAARLTQAIDTPRTRVTNHGNH